MLDEGQSVRVEPRRRRRPVGPPDPISMMLADRPQTGVTYAGGDARNARERDRLYGEDTSFGEPHPSKTEGFGPRYQEDFGRTGLSDDDEEPEEPEEPNPLEALLAMLQGGGEPGGGEEEEYRPVDEEGDPWGMDTDPGDSQVLRNLLGLRRQGLQQGRYR